MIENLLLIGKISKPHGIAGKVRIVSYAESVETFHKLDKLYLKGKEGSFRPLRIDSVASGNKTAIIGFEGIINREGAKEIAGTEIFIEKDGLDKLPPGEYYQYQLIGINVETTDGLRLGTISEIIETGSNDVFVIKDGKTEHLVPALKDVIREVNLEERLMIIKPLEAVR